MKRILLSLLSITAVSSIALAASGAFFSDTEISTGNVLQAGSVDLLINNTSYYNGNFWAETSWNTGNLLGQFFFNFDDLKPGDWGEDTISITVDDNDAWACYDITMTSNDDNGSTEPELLVDDPDDEGDDFDGELAGLVNFAFWIDDGDNVYELGEEFIASGSAEEIIPNLSGPLADSSQGLLVEDGEPLIGGNTYHIGKYWCFGNMANDPQNQDDLGFVQEEGANGPDTRGSGFACDGSEYDNITQTDQMTGDINFSAVQSRHNPDFLCNPQDLVCTDEEPAYLGEAVLLGTTQGLRNNGSPVLANRSNPDEALGLPYTPVNTVPNPPEWYSLGFGGVITLKYDNPVGNGSGDDLIFYEVTGGRNSYPMEKALVAVSDDGSTWHNVGEINSEPGGDGVVGVDVDSSGLDTFQWVRVTDTTVPGDHDQTADGYDLDAIEAVYGVCEPVGGEEIPGPGVF